MGIPVILFGAFDRHNFGDLLFPHVAAALLPGRDLRFAGLAERDLRGCGGDGLGLRLAGLLGLALAPLDAASRAKFGIGPEVRGMMVDSVDQSSDAAQRGLRKGDVVTRAGDRDVNSAADFAAVVDAARKAGRTSVLVGVHRGGRTSFLPLKIAG